MSITAAPPVTTPFDAKATADEVSKGIDLAGKRVVITGGASGIGLETTRTLARLGADVTVAVRDTTAAEQALAGLRHSARAKVATAHLDLTDIASVQHFVRSWAGPLHLLINNAGVMAIQNLTLSPEGWETQLATNYLGHFRLTHGLHDALAEGANNADSGRVVSLSSSGHLFSPVVFDDLGFRFRPYDPLQAYAQSKTAVNLFALEASKRWAADGITVNAVNPGAIATPLQRHVGGKLSTPVDMQKSTQQGASTTVLVATTRQLNGIGGRYFNDNQESVLVDQRPTNVAELVNSVARYSLDEANAERLWELTLPALG
jgi:NAD(P)-dependent dehydrogenase (short-subunit alcohol dehydrogenase family)